ncbi:MAG: TRAP transporter small permease [Clostridia bacterium]|nr:TRAP transporter small permease [Clostridia bacterium]
MQALKKISSALDKICGVCIVIMLGLMVIFTMAQIICRTWFTALSWSEEATRFLLIWSTFFGATCVYRHSGNIAITALQGAMPPKVKKVMTITVHVVCLILFVVLFVNGVQYCNKQVRMAAAIPVKMKYIYSCLPISMVILAIHALTMMLEEIFSLKKEVK